MARKQRKIYTATNKDNKVIMDWIEDNQWNDETKDLWFLIMEFYFDWITKHHRQTDSIYHNSIYRILKAIGLNPLTDKEKAKERQDDKK